MTAVRMTLAQRRSTLPFVVHPVRPYVLYLGSLVLIRLQPKQSRFYSPKAPSRPMLSIPQRQEQPRFI